jgi:two-component system NtrC family sensor kinase
VKAERLAAMGQTIAMLSHHIKNILQGVRGGSYLIDMGLQSTDDALVRKGWGIVERNQNKIYNLVMDMLTFSKERTPVLKPTQLNEIAADVCELMMARATECSVGFVFEAGEQIPETQFDPEAIQRAILNVVTNAIDAVESIEGGRVLVQTGYDAESDALFVTVADNGPGIPPEQMAGLFNVFESTKGARGTGLGLAVSKKILHEHGGEIGVESEVGAGCRFTLAWPCCDEEHRASDQMTLSGE